MERDQIEALHQRYLQALDNQDMDGWIDCFDPAVASYICTTQEDRAQGLDLALMMDDTFARIKDRAKFVTEVWSGTYENYTTRHFIQTTNTRQDGPRLFASDSNFMVLFTSAQGQMEVLTSGVYQDKIVICDGGSAKFRSRIAVLDTVATPRYLVFPV